MSLVSEGDWLMHIGRSIDDGAPVGSGRYPKGSGERPYQDMRVAPLWEQMNWYLSENYFDEFKMDW